VCVREGWEAAGFVTYARVSVPSTPPVCVCVVCEESGCV
jgi:hypothetical protein